LLAKARFGKGLHLLRGRQPAASSAVLTAGLLMRIVLAHPRRLGRPQRAPNCLQRGQQPLDIEVDASGTGAQALDPPAKRLDAPAQCPELLALPKGGDDSFGQRSTVVVHPGGLVVRELILYLGKSLFGLEAALDPGDDGLLLLRR